MIKLTFLLFTGIGRCLGGHHALYAEAAPTSKGLSSKDAAGDSSSHETLFFTLSTECVPSALASASASASVFKTHSLQEVLVAAERNDSTAHEMHRYLTSVLLHCNGKPNFVFLCRRPKQLRRGRSCRSCPGRTTPGRGVCPPSMQPLPGGLKTSSSKAPSARSPQTLETP